MSSWMLPYLTHMQHFTAFVEHMQYQVLHTFTAVHHCKMRAGCSLHTVRTALQNSHFMLCWTAEVYVWGRGEYGRLGLGDKGGSSRLRPCKVKAIEGHRVVQVIHCAVLHASLSSPCPTQQRKQAC